MLHIFFMLFKLPMLARGPRLFELFILDPMLETLLFIAAASAIPQMAKARRVNEVSRRFPIIGTFFSGILPEDLSSNCLSEVTIYTRIASALFYVASSLIA